MSGFAPAKNFVERDSPIFAFASSPIAFVAVAPTRVTPMARTSSSFSSVRTATITTRRVGVVAVGSTSEGDVGK